MIKLFNENQESIDLSYSDSDVNQLERWSKETNIFVILPTIDPNDLEEAWNKWNSMTDAEKTQSDAKSMEVLGINNYTHYVGLLSVFYNSNPDGDLTPDNYVSANRILENSRNTFDLFNNTIEYIKEDNSYFNKRKAINKSKDILNKITSIKEYNIPYFSPFFLPDKILSLGAYNMNKKDNYFSESPDNIYLDNDKKIHVKKWFNEYLLLSKGFASDNSKRYMELWRDKLTDLYEDYNMIKKSNDIHKINARKQSILELGWNPEIDFNINNRIKCNKDMKDHIQSLYEDTSIFDISDLNTSENEFTIVKESTEKEELIPIYIMLSYTFTNFGKIITKFTNSLYSHAALSLDSTLTHLYSFNAKNGMNKTGGFSLESIKDYPNKKGESRIAVFCIFVKKNDYLNLKMKLSDFINNIKNTSYGFLNIFGVVFNKPIQKSNSMICSEFVDYLLKSINIDLTKKNFSLTTPKDIYLAKKKNKKIYKVFEGLISDYDPDKIANKMNKILHKAKYIKEGVSILSESEFFSILNKDKDNLDNILYLEQFDNVLKKDTDIYNLYENCIKNSLIPEPLLEAKEFPAGFDKDGNLFIKRHKRLDFETEYANSHKLLRSYSGKKNYYGTAYELCKLWYMNTLLENKIYNEKHNDEEFKKYHKARAKILNDFTKYLKEFLENNKDFNFTDYYNRTPFSDDEIKISKHTLHYSGLMLKNIIKTLIR